MKLVNEIMIKSGKEILFSVEKWLDGTYTVYSEVFEVSNEELNRNEMLIFLDKAIASIRDKI
jgi:hypothetical protein